MTEIQIRSREMYRQGLSVSEIAAACGVPVATVEWSLYNFRTREARIRRRARMYRQGLSEEEIAIADHGWTHDVTDDLYSAGERLRRERRETSAVPEKHRAVFARFGLCEICGDEAVGDTGRCPVHPWPGLPREPVKRNREMCGPPDF